MPKRIQPTVIFLLLVCAPACSKLASASGEQTAAPPASAAAPAAPALSAKADPDAVNAADVRRFPDEKKLDARAKLEWSGSKVHTEPQGRVVAILSKGTEVEEHAEHAGFILITFADPKDASRRLTGWIYKDAFKPGGGKFTGPVAVKHAHEKNCPPGYGTDEPDGDLCVRKCTSNDDCPGDNFCDDIKRDDIDGRGVNLGQVRYCRHGND